MFSGSRSEQTTGSRRRSPAASTPSTAWERNRLVHGSLNKNENVHSVVAAQQCAGVGCLQRRCRSQLFVFSCVAACNDCLIAVCSTVECADKRIIRGTVNTPDGKNRKKHACAPLPSIGDPFVL